MSERITDERVKAWTEEAYRRFPAENLGTARYAYVEGCISAATAVERELASLREQVRKDAAEIGPLPGREG